MRREHMGDHSYVAFGGYYWVKRVKGYFKILSGPHYHTGEEQHEISPEENAFQVVEGGVWSGIPASIEEEIILDFLHNPEKFETLVHRAFEDDWVKLYKVLGALKS